MITFIMSFDLEDTLSTEKLVKGIPGYLSVPKLSILKYFM